MYIENKKSLMLKFQKLKHRFKQAIWKNVPVITKYKAERIFVVVYIENIMYYNYSVIFWCFRYNLR